MECDAFSEECGRCWLHPGKRFVGVCSVCLNDRLGRLSRHPPQFSFNSSDFPSDEATCSQAEVSLLTCDTDVGGGNGITGSSSSYLMMNRSRSVSERKALSPCSYGFSSEETLADSSSSASAPKSTIEKLFTACHSGAEFKPSSAKHKTAETPTKGSNSKQHQTHLLLGDDKFTSSSRSLKDLFFRVKDRQQATFALTDSESAKSTPGLNKINNEKAQNLDPDTQVMQNIASLMQKDLQHKNHPWYSLFFKAGKMKEAPRTQDPHRSSHSTSSSGEDLHICGNSSVGCLDIQPSVSQLRSKSVRGSSWRMDASMATATSLPRSRSVSHGGTHDSGLQAVREGDRDMPSMKQVSPLMPHTVLDEPLDVSTDMNSSNSLAEAHKTISSLIARDLSEKKSCNNPLARRLHAKLSSPECTSSKSKQKATHLRTQTHSLPDAIRPEKPAKASMPSNGKQKKLHNLPFFSSKEYSIINFSISPLKFSKRKCAHMVVE